MGGYAEFVDGEKDVQLKVWGHIGSEQYAVGDVLDPDELWEWHRASMQPVNVRYVGEALKNLETKIRETYIDISKYQKMFFVASYDKEHIVVIEDGVFTGIIDELKEPLWDEWGNRISIAKVMAD